MNGAYRRNELNAAFWSGAWLLGLALVFSFFVTTLMLTSPMFMLLVYDRVLSSRSQESLVALFGLVVLLLILLGLFDYARGRLLARFGARLQERLETRVLEAVEARATRTRGGANLSAGTRELDGLRGFFHSDALIAVLDFVWAPIFLGAVFLFHPMLGWIALTGVIVLGALSLLRAAFSGHLAEDAKSASSAVGDVTGRIRDSRQALLTQGMAAPVTGKWLEARKASRDMAIVLNDRVAWFAAASKFARMLFQSLMLALGANLVIGHQLTVGGMVACFILAARVFLPVEQFLKKIPSLGEAIRNWKELDAILKVPLPLRTEGGVLDMRRGLDLRDLRVKRRDGRGMIFDGISMSVEPGQVARITGDAGAGKTLLAHAIIGQQVVADGRITLGGRNISQFWAEELGRRVGYLPESIGFFPGTIFANICKMDPEARVENVVVAAKLAGGHAMISSLPNGYDTRIDAHGATLSRRQRQTVALARAVYGKPRLLLLDEPDATMVERLCAVPRGQRSGAPAILILGAGAADLPADTREFQLHDGRLVGLAAMQTRATNTPKLVKG